jgi:hypothetical protein
MRATRFALVAVFLAWAPIVSAQTVDEVIEKSITCHGRTRGDREDQDPLDDRNASLSTPGRRHSRHVEVQNAAPNKMRTVIKADLSAFGAGQLLIDQRFDGTNGYMINSMQGDQPITGSQLDNMKSNSFPAPVPRLQGEGRQGDAERQGKGRRSRRVRRGVRAERRDRRSGQFIDAESYLPVRLDGEDQHAADR